MLFCCTHQSWVLEFLRSTRVLDYVSGAFMHHGLSRGRGPHLVLGGMARLGSRVAHGRRSVASKFSVSSGEKMAFSMSKAGPTREQMPLPSSLPPKQRNETDTVDACQ